MAELSEKLVIMGETLLYKITAEELDNLISNFDYYLRDINHTPSFKEYELVFRALLELKYLYRKE